MVKVELVGCINRSLRSMQGQYQDNPWVWGLSSWVIGGAVSETGESEGRMGLAQVGDKPMNNDSIFRCFQIDILLWLWTSGMKLGLERFIFILAIWRRERDVIQRAGGSLISSGTNSGYR